MTKIFSKRRIKADAVSVYSNRLYAYIDSFLKVNPKPSMRQCVAMLFSVGVPQTEAVQFLRSLGRSDDMQTVTAALRKEVRAYTKFEKVSQDQYDPMFTAPDYLLINDEPYNQDNANLQNELAEDGDLDPESVEEDQDNLAYDGQVRFG